MNQSSHGRPNPSFLSSGSQNSKRFRPPGGIPPYIWMTAGGTTALFGYCYFAFLDEAPLTKRKRWIATSPQWERQLGDQEYKQLLKTFRKDILPPNHRAAITVQRVGSRITQAARDFSTDHNLQATLSKSPYTYTVVRSDMANAFVLPGNHIFVMTGLFQYVRDEDELAAVLSHEIAVSP
jgi:predicted Zn-dependent protease